MRALSDLTVTDQEKVIQHNSALGKLPMTVKGYDNTCLHVLAVYNGGGATPASWVGQRVYIPLALLTSS
jgi:hypothetical protein